MFRERIVAGVIGASMLVAACGTSVASPQAGASDGTTATAAAPSAPAATAPPTIPSTARPDVAALFYATYSKATSGTITATGSATVGAETKEFRTVHQFTADSERNLMSVGSGPTLYEREEIRVGDDRYRRETPWPWLPDERDPASAGSGMAAAVLAAARATTDAGPATFLGRDARRLVPSGTAGILPSMFGIAVAANAEVTSSITFYALEDGRPLGLEILLEWTSPTGAKEPAGNLRLTMNLMGIGGSPAISKPEDVWKRVGSEAHHYTMAVPDGWIAHPGKAQDEYTITFGSSDSLLLLGHRLIVGRFALGGGDLDDAVRAVKATRRDEFGCKPTTEPMTIAGRDGVVLTCDGSQYSSREIIVTRGKYFYEIVWVYDRFAGALFGKDIEAQRTETLTRLAATFSFA